MLRCYSDSRSCPCSDATRTPAHESSSSNSVQTSAHVRARTLLGLPLMSTLEHYLDSCPRPHSELRVYPCYKFSELHSDVRSDIRVSIHLTSPSPCLRTPFGPLSLSALFLYLQVRTLVIQFHSLSLHLHPIPLFEPTPSDPIRTSILVCVTIRTLAIQLCLDIRSGVRSDIHVSLRLTSSSPCLQGPLGPPSLSTLRVPRRSKLLVTV
jgi:hypothetical protein